MFGMSEEAAKAMTHFWACGGAAAVIQWRFTTDTNWMKPPWLIFLGFQGGLFLWNGYAFVSIVYRVNWG